MKFSLYLLTGLTLAFGHLAQAQQDENFTKSGRCTGAGAKYVENGRDGLDIKPSLNLIARAAGKKINLFSCFRDQSVQNSLLKARGCRPYGSRDCSQSTARHSAHTYTIAADIGNISRDLRKQCQILAKGRSVAGGRGGVGTYPRGDGHFDMGRLRSWNRCRGVVASNSYSSAVVSNYKNSRSAGRCYPTKSYPNCCGPIRRSRGLCSG